MKHDFNGFKSDNFEEYYKAQEPISEIVLWGIRLFFILFALSLIIIPIAVIITLVIN